MLKLSHLIALVTLGAVFFGWMWTDEIHEAAKAGDTARLKELLAKDHSLVNSVDKNKMTPLHHAITAGKLDAAILLIRSEANVNAVDYQGRTPLHIAANSGNAEATKLLLENGADTSMREMRDRTPLFLACSWGRDLETVRLLIDAGSDVNFRNANNELLLVYSLFTGDKEIIDLLIDNGAKIPEDENVLWYVLNVSAANGLERPFNIAVEKSKKLGMEWWRGVSTQDCARGGSVNIAKALIAKGVDFRKKNRYGVEPLHIAAENGRKELVEFLLAYGADIESHSKMGWTALHFARENGHTDLVTILVDKGASQAPPKFPELKGDYLGQPAPGDTPQPFALGIVSTQGLEGLHSPAVFSPDGNEVYWTKKYKGPIMFMTRENGLWTAPQKAPFCSEFGDGEPFFSPDGSKIFFLSFRPTEPGGATDKENMWFIERTADGWSEPEPVSPMINAYNLHWLFSVANNGTIYFSAVHEGGFGLNDIYRSRLVAGKYAEPENLGKVINSSGIEHTPYIAPDESYLIYVSTRGSSNPRDMIFHVSYRNDDGSWMEPINIGEEINTVQYALCPAVTPDGKYLFFIGEGGIYWTSAGFIEELRPKK